MQEVDGLRRVVEHALQRLEGLYWLAVVLLLILNVLFLLNNVDYLLLVLTLTHRLRRLNAEVFFD